MDPKRSDYTVILLPFVSHCMHNDNFTCHKLYTGEAKNVLSDTFRHCHNTSQRCRSQNLTFTTTNTKKVRITGFYLKGF